MQIRTARAGDEKSIADVIVNTWKLAYRDIVPDSFINSLTTDIKSQNPIKLGVWDLYFGVAETLGKVRNAIYPQLIVEIYSCRYNRRLIDVDSGQEYNGNNKTDNTEKG